MGKTLTPQEIVADLIEASRGDMTWLDVSIMAMNRWLARGDGIAVYENVELGHPECGHQQTLSYGSMVAGLVGDTPPERLPDFGNKINWRYQLIGTYRDATAQGQLSLP